MSLTLSPPQVLNPPFGTLISYADWNQLLNFTLQTDGFGVAFQQGVENAQTLLQPLTLTADGTDMVVTLGGANQFVLCNALMCGTSSATPYTVPNNSSGITRTDKIWILPNLNTISTVSREVEDLDGNKTVQNIPVVINALLSAYDPGGTSPPGGNYVEYATIAVPNGATAITNGEITILFPLMTPQGPPGPTGAAGTNGTNGSNGTNGTNGSPGHGSTTTTGNITIPNINSAVSVPVVDGTAFPNGTFVILSDGSHVFMGEVTGGGTTNALTITNLTVVAGAVGDTVASGGSLTFSGPANTGSTGGASTIAAQAGIVFCSKYFNYGTQSGSPLSSGSDHLTPLATTLGAILTPGAQQVGTGTTLEIHMLMKVQPGAGAQPIGGSFITNSRNTFISIDGSSFFTSGLVTTTQSWSTNVPDDGATHTLIIHFDIAFANGILTGEIGPFLPQAASGGLDPAKFASAGPGF